MLEQLGMLSYRGICWNSLEYKVIRVYVGTAWNKKLSGYILEQLEILNYQGTCWSSLKCKVMSVYVGTA